VSINSKRRRDAKKRKAARKSNRQKAKKNGQRKRKPFQSVLTPNLSMQSFEKQFLNSQKKIIRTLKKYSLKDIFTALFVSNLWIPNVSSPIKHQFLYGLLFSIDPDELSGSDMIFKYPDLVKFLKTVYKDLIEFPSVEDYRPESDWGEIKYEIDGTILTIFYGNEFSNINEYISLFEMVFCTYDENLFDLTGRSPTNELKQCFKIQDLIIKSIDSQKRPDPYDVKIGNIEIPSKAFFHCCIDFLNNQKLEKVIDKEILKEFQLNDQGPFGTLFSSAEFMNKVMQGKFIKSFWLNHDGTIYPILPRKYFSTLFDTWGDIFSTHKNAVLMETEPHNFKLSSKFYKYVKDRIDNKILFPVVSSVDEIGKPNSFIFDCAFISENKLVLLHLLPPSSSDKEIKKYLENDIENIEDAQKELLRNPTTIALNLEQQNLQFKHETGKEILTPYFITLIPQVSTQIYGLNIPKKYPGDVYFLDAFLGVIDEIYETNEFSKFLDYTKEYQKKMGPMYSFLDLYGSYKDSSGVLIKGAIEPDRISIDPHWGTDRRFRTLQKFWEKFPNVGYFNAPRSWKVKTDTPSRIRLVSRSHFGFTLYSKKMNVSG